MKEEREIASTLREKALQRGQECVYEMRCVAYKITQANNTKIDATTSFGSKARLKTTVIRKCRDKTNFTNKKRKKKARVSL